MNVRLSTLVEISRYGETVVKLFPASGGVNACRDRIAGMPDEQLLALARAVDALGMAVKQMNHECVSVNDQA